jgi:hypothetical protein
VDAFFEKHAKHGVLGMIGLVERQTRSAVWLFVEAVEALGAGPQRFGDCDVTRQFVQAGLGDDFPGPGLAPDSK